MKKTFEKRFGEGTAWDLDYGKLLMIGLLVYIAFFKDFTWNVHNIYNGKLCLL